MRVQQSKKQFLVFYMSGFFVGIVYANIVSKYYFEAHGVFNEYFLQQFRIADVVPKEYLGYVMRVRLVPFAILLGAGCTKWKRAAVIVCLAWTGFASGIVLTSGVIQMGLAGIVICAAGVLPHILFYVPALVVYLWYLYLYPQVKWNSSKSIFVALTFLVGIILEGYISPAILRLAIEGIS